MDDLRKESGLLKASGERARRRRFGSERGVSPFGGCG